MRWQELLGDRWQMEGKGGTFENPERWYIFGDYVSVPFIENDFGGRQTAVAIEKWGNIDGQLAMALYSDWADGYQEFHRVFHVDRLPEVEAALSELVYSDSSLVSVCEYIDDFQDEMVGSSDWGAVL